MLASKPTILFLTLKTFGFTGGIEKMCRVVCRALYETEEEEKSRVFVYSMYDKAVERDSRYIPLRSFCGFAKKRIWFAISSIWKGMDSSILVLSHVNLLFIAFLIHLFKPQVKIYLFAHGIEIWPRLPRWKRFFLKKTTIIAVSQFTKEKIIESQNLKAESIIVLNNALDPFYEYPHQFSKPQNLLERYHLKASQPVLFTLTRLSASEKYKGYDVVIEVLPQVIAHFPDIKYLISGKYDKIEKKRIELLIAKHQLQDHVLFSGFIDEIELTEHFLLADLFIMPSKKEGFGIVFIEAMASGLRTIGGNQDGTTDALKNGKLGTLVDPDDKEEVLSAILQQLKLQIIPASKLQLQENCKRSFSFENYKQLLENILFQ